MAQSIADFAAQANAQFASVKALALELHTQINAFHNSHDPLSGVDQITWNAILLTAEKLLAAARATTSVPLSGIGAASASAPGYPKTMTLAGEPDRAVNNQHEEMALAAHGWAVVMAPVAEPNPGNTAFVGQPAAVPEVVPEPVAVGEFPVVYEKTGFPNWTVKDAKERQAAIDEGFAPVVAEKPVAAQA